MTAWQPGWIDPADERWAFLWPKENLMSDPDDFCRQINIRAFKSKDSSDRQRMIRLYCLQTNSSWALQLRMPLGIGPFGTKDGKDFVIAHARLSRNDMEALRDAIDVALKDLSPDG